MSRAREMPSAEARGFSKGKAPLPVIVPSERKKDSTISLLILFNHPSKVFGFHKTPYLFVYFSPVPLLTAGRSAIRSIHFSRCGKGFISS